MAPEVHLMGDASVSRKVHHYGKEADLWGLGVILHVMLTCIMPFGNEDSQQMVAEIKAKADASQPPVEWGLMQGEAWEPVSDQAKSLIQGLLCPDVQKRYTADVCREHPWMQDGGQDVPTKASPKKKAVAKASSQAPELTTSKPHKGGSRGCRAGL